ncbi:MAG: hypothetical protein R3E90_11240 [Marinicella sp.]|nr:hypothetical protein [Xanthomonadales bacterium]
MSELRKNFHNHELHHLIMTVNQRNLVYNHDFQYFSNANYAVDPVDYGVPDGYQYMDQGSNGGVNLVNDHLVITTSNDDQSVMVFKQALHEFPRWQQTLCNQTVTACIQLSATSGSSISVLLSDGVNSSIEKRVVEDEDEMIIELQLFVDTHAEELVIQLQSHSNASVITISKIYANIGQVAVSNLPCMIDGVIGQTQQLIATCNPPSNQLSLCQSAIELSENMTRLDSVLNGRFGRGDQGRSYLPDIRGLFMRSWDNGAQTDPNAKERKSLGRGSTISGDLVGTIQEDVFEKHVHTIDFTIGELKPSGDMAPIYPVINKLQETSEVGGDETRPKNVYELYTIKWA